jgi:hypothetical protein
MSIMKKSIISLLMTTLFLIAVGQDTSQIKIKRLNVISDRFMMQKKDPERIQMYTLYSTYFIDNNIYPNSDAIDLIEAYNKNASYTEIKNNTKIFKPLLLNATNVELRKREELIQSTQITAIPERIKTASVTFNQKLEKVNKLSNALLPDSFKQSLLNFKRVVLPRINNNANNIPALQLDFFLTSLSDINHYMDALADSTNRAATINVISDLMDDFVVYEVKPLKAVNPSYHTGRNSYHASSLLARAEMPAPADNADLPNADVYVYTRDSLGKWDNKPKQDAFNVYYAANGLKYSLTPGCDTLSFFRYRPSVPASTLPITLAKGNYCFVLQSVSDHKLFLRTDINLRDNKVVDEQQLIKLCFKVDD